MKDIAHMLELMNRPAFCVEGGVIIAANREALARQIPLGEKVEPMLLTGAQEYRSFSGGCLCVRLRCCDGIYDAQVSELEAGQIFTLEPESAGEELRLLALTAQVLRNPLGDVLALAEELPEDADPERVARIRRGLYQLLRIVSNLSMPWGLRLEMQDVDAVLREFCEKAERACESKGVRLCYRGASWPVYSNLDAQMLTRAIHNLLSNSMKFSPGQTLTLELRRKGSRLHILYTDPGALMPPDPFTRYLRDPGLEDPRLGLGMGLKLVTTAAVAHQGCAFLVPRKTGGVTTVLDLPIRQDTPLRSNRHRISYTGERDALLVELSDVLPPEFYK
jgi:signal transduction histidine kinase